jgi:DNA-binding transcriptional ArsR family regulator
MAFPKHALYSQESQATSNFFRALGFPGRLEILMQLELEGPLSVQQLAKSHPICKETLSQHLKILREAGLVIANEKFPFTYYRVHKANLKKARKLFDRFFSHFSGI